eukprot:TRINITY_DN43723_c0_g1_i1.p1 TRINITY_DN43723_c0_g1~~TRINITY_DN43723_c0_g1_i1.p1  ORF type:complete len:120 (-),score=14.89 TRINITY_DN43723_c0_g1_i1:12-371(-)
MQAETFSWMVFLTGLTSLEIVLTIFFSSFGSLKLGPEVKKSIEFEIQLDVDFLGGRLEICSWSHVLCVDTVSYTHLRAHETSLHLVCRLLLEKKKKNHTIQYTSLCITSIVHLSTINPV